MYGDLGLPSRQDPPLGLIGVVQRRAEQYVWHQLGCRSCWRVVKLTTNRLRGSTPDFCKVYSLAFSSPEDTYKAAGMRQVVLGYILPVEKGEVALRTGRSQVLHLRAPA